MASYIDMETNAKYLAYPQDSWIGVCPSAVRKGLLASDFYIYL